MPTVGAGMAYPLTKKIVLGFQAGIGKVFIDEKETVFQVSLFGDTQTREIDLDPDDSMSYNAEVGLNFLPINNMIVQIGYRYQQWEFDPQIDDGSEGSDSCTDVTHGPSLAVVYTF